jgi:hypothetical protein
VKKTLATAFLLSAFAGNASAAEAVFSGGFAVVGSTGCLRDYSQFRRPSVYHSPITPNLNLETIALHGNGSASLYATSSKPFSRLNPVKGTLIEDGRLIAFVPTVTIARVYKNASGAVINGSNLAGVEFIKITGKITKFANDRSTCQVTFMANYSRVK